MEPVTLTAAGIATLAFGEFIKAGAGEIAKKTIAGIEPLRSMIKQRFAGQKKAEAAIKKIEQDGSPEALNKLSVYLDDEMEDVTFAQSLQQLANQITNVQNNVDRQYNNYGRDQIANANIAQLLDRVIQGEEIIISQDGQPIARISPAKRITFGLSERIRSPRIPGQYAGKLTIPEDFNDPLPDDILNSFLNPTDPQ